MMRQLTVLKPGRFGWQDVPAQVLMTDTDAIVREIAVARTSRLHSRTTPPAVLECPACGKPRAEAVPHRCATFADAPQALLDPGPKILFVPSAISCLRQ
jgi:hypothetical protein